VHTHERPRDDGPAIYLVRDGRDALVSRAHQLAEEGHRSFLEALEWLVDRPFTDDNPSSGSWGANVLAWLERRPSLVRFEDLISHPEATVDGALASAGIVVATEGTGPAPTFEELHARDPGFFRRGRIGSHRDELPDGVHERFWRIEENAEALRRLGYDDR
jgi:hypothetical protein